MAALQAARQCDLCVDDNPCEMAVIIGDDCECPVPLSAWTPDLVKSALSARDAWVNAGCGPYQCGGDCAVSDYAVCQPDGSGDCTGFCAFGF
jgi:hypothetical protein